MLYLAPQWVNRAAIPDGNLGIEEEGPMSGIKRYVNMKEHSEPGVIGRPSAATPEIGETLYTGAFQALQKAIQALQHQPNH
jgi:creatinine amidohydrolase/Fe(II)-dependent formamide hydrolase-like protein